MTRMPSGVLREAQDVQPTVKTPDSHIANFAIFLSCVSQNMRGFKLELRHKPERKLALPDVPRVLAWSETDAHNTNCMHN